jgi:uncharacterized protein with FMN-binding domain
MRYFLAAILCGLVFVAGCAPSQKAIEDSIREEMKKSLAVEITTINLQKQADGSYIGTANAANGDTYDVTTAAPKGNRTEWKAIPGQNMCERILREGIQQQLNQKVTSFNLTKQSPGTYSGTADTESGMKLKVSTTMQGTQLSWTAEQTR